jgi:uncharacterized protein YjiS (DUF1127 family)
MTSLTDLALDRACATAFAAPARHRVSTAGHGYVFVRLIAIWIERARQRHALADLDDRLLSDIGITRREATGECGKPFWR